MNASFFTPSEFHYDAAMHWERPTSRGIIWMRASAVLVVLLVVLNGLSSEEPSNLRVAMDLIIISFGIFQIIFPIKMAKPFLLKGQRYIEFENGVLRWKLNSGAAMERIALSDVRAIRRTTSVVELVDVNGRSKILETFRIKHRAKFLEFLKKLDEWEELIIQQHSEVDAA